MFILSWSRILLVDQLTQKRKGNKKMKDPKECIRLEVSDDVDAHVLAELFRAHGKDVDVRGSGLPWILKVHTKGDDVQGIIREAIAVQQTSQLKKYELVRSLIRESGYSPSNDLLNKINYLKRTENDLV